MSHHDEPSAPQTATAKPSVAAGMAPTQRRASATRWAPSLNAFATSAIRFLNTALTVAAMSVTLTACGLLPTGDEDPPDTLREDGGPDVPVTGGADVDGDGFEAGADVTEDNTSDEGFDGTGMPPLAISCDEETPCEDEASGERCVEGVCTRLYLQQGVTGAGWRGVSSGAFTSSGALSADPVTSVMRSADDRWSIFPAPGELNPLAP